MYAMRCTSCDVRHAMCVMGCVSCDMWFIWQWNVHGEICVWRHASCDINPQCVMRMCVKECASFHIWNRMCIMRFCVVRHVMCFMGCVSYDDRITWCASRYLRHVTCDVCHGMCILRNAMFVMRCASRDVRYGMCGIRFASWDVLSAIFDVRYGMCLMLYIYI